MFSFAARRADADACPGALRLHTAADGPLARIRLPGGRLTGAQLRAVRELAQEFGDGQAELTSRANLQLRALTDAPAETLAARLRTASLLPSDTHDLIRNILASPLPDRTAPLPVDPAQLDRSLCADPELAALPGRFLFALDTGAFDVAAQADVAAVPATALGGPPGQVAILLAGIDVGLRVPTAEAMPALLATAHAFLAEQNSQADQTDQHTPADQTTWAKPTTHTERAGHAAQGGQTIQNDRGADGGRAVQSGQARRAWRVRELADGPVRVSARVAAALGVRLGSGGALPEPGRRGLVGLLTQPGGLVAVGVAVPLGRLSGVQMKVLEEADAIVVTPWRGVVLPGLTPAAAAQWAQALAGVGLEVHSGSRWAGVTACAGRPGCAKALADVRTDAAAFVRAADLPAGSGAGGRGGSGAGGRADAVAGVGAGTSGDVGSGGRGEGSGRLPVHWVGCGRGCGSPAGPHVRVEANGSGYTVQAPGSSGAATGVEVGALVAAARRM